MRRLAQILRSSGGSKDVAAAAAFARDILSESVEKLSRLEVRPLGLVEAKLRAIDDLDTCIGC